MIADTNPGYVCVQGGGRGGGGVLRAGRGVERGHDARRRQGRVVRQVPLPQGRHLQEGGSAGPRRGRARDLLVRHAPGTAGVWGGRTQARRRPAAGGWPSAEPKLPSSSCASSVGAT